MVEIDWEGIVAFLKGFRKRHRLPVSTMAKSCGLTLDEWMRLELGRTNAQTFKHNNKFWKYIGREFYIRRKSVTNNNGQLFFRM